MKLSIREALESTCSTRSREEWGGKRTSSLPTERELTLHKDHMLRFLSEVSANGDDDMTVSDLIAQLEDYP